MEKNAIYYIYKGELDIQKIRVVSWYQNILNPDPVNLWLKLKYNADFFSSLNSVNSWRAQVKQQTTFSWFFSVSSSYTGFSLQK